VVALDVQCLSSGTVPGKFALVYTNPNFEVFADQACTQPIASGAPVINPNSSTRVYVKGLSGSDPNDDASITLYYCPTGEAVASASPSTMSFAAFAAAPAAAPTSENAPLDKVNVAVVGIKREYDALGESTKAAVYCAWLLGRWLADGIALAWELFGAREVRLAGGPLSGKTGIFITLSARRALEEVYGFDLEAAEDALAANAQLLPAMIHLDFLLLLYRGISYRKKRDDLQIIVLGLSPMVPHICHSLWHELGHEQALIDESWPKPDAAALKQDTVEIIVQVNGKLRGKVQVANGADQATAHAAAMADEGVRRFAGEAPPRRVVYVPGKLLNIVV